MTPAIAFQTSSATKACLPYAVKFGNHSETASGLVKLKHNPVSDFSQQAKGSIRNTLKNAELRYADSPPLTKAQRLEVFREVLQKAPVASSMEEASGLIQSATYSVERTFYKGFYGLAQTMLDRASHDWLTLLFNPSQMKQAFTEVLKQYADKECRLKMVPHESSLDMNHADRAGQKIGYLAFTSHVVLLESSGAIGIYPRVYPDHAAPKTTSTVFYDSQNPWFTKKGKSA